MSTLTDIFKKALDFEMANGTIGIRLTGLGLPQGQLDTAKAYSAPALEKDDTTTGTRVNLFGRYLDLHLAESPEATFTVKFDT